MDKLVSVLVGGLLLIATLIVLALAVVAIGAFIVVVHSVIVSVKEQIKKRSNK